MSAGTHRARALWCLYEPVHAITYFTPGAKSAFEAAGLRGFWRGYFAGRAAPLGAVGAAPVIASFFGFAPSMVSRAIPDAWTRAAPERALEARLTGSVAVLGALLDGVPGERINEAADLLEQAADGADPGGRVLAAANAALPRPRDVTGRLWQAATTLREHRGDGHVAALVSAGLDGCEALALRAALDGTREAVQPYRGWTDEEWSAATGRLADRGWLDRSGGLTDEGRARHRAIEEATDEAADRPWDRLGPEGVARLTSVLTPVSDVCSAVLPRPNPIGLPVRT